VPVANAFVIPNRIGDNVYFYKLTAGNGSGVGKGNVSKEPAAFRASPNPFRTFTTLRLSGRFSGEIGVYDVRGKKAAGLKLCEGNAEWKAQGLPAGIYTAVYRNGNLEKRLRLILLK